MEKDVLRLILASKVVRFAFPQRSPSPLMVPCIMEAPFSMAAMLIATPCPVSLWAWIPICVLGKASATLATISATS